MDARAAGVLVCCLLAVAGVMAGSAVAVAGGAGVAESPDRDPGIDRKSGAVNSGFAVDRESGIDLGGAGAGDQPSTSSAGFSSLRQDDGTDAESENVSIEGYDGIQVEISLHGTNGSADWTVQYRYRLDGANATDAWEDLRDDVRERPDAYIEAFEERWADELEIAIEETGRDEMELSDFRVEASNRSGVQEYGFLTFEFRWAKFAHVELDHRIEAGDALEGFVLDDRTQLLIEWPPEYNATDIQPEPDDPRESAAFWYGDETEFVDGEPRIELLRTEGAEIEGPGDEDDGMGIPWLALAVAVVLAVVGAGGWFVTRGGNGGDDGAPVEGADPGASNGPPPELLSNEERVLRLLEDNGGRIKQQEVVSELDWTEAKTSQVVGDLREEGVIDVFRIGRENVLTLPEERADVPDADGIGEEETDVSGGT